MERRAQSADLTGEGTGEKQKGRPEGAQKQASEAREGKRSVGEKGGQVAEGKEEKAPSDKGKCLPNPVRWHRQSEQLSLARES